MSRYTWLLDAGHGGFIDGEYQTAGKRSPAFPDGTILYEGEFNRDVVKYIMKSGRSRNMLKALGAKNELTMIDLVASQEDIPLRERVRRANKLQAEKGNCIYVSVHANAFGNGKDFNKAKGVCTFHHYGSGKGQILAESLQKHLADLTLFRDRGVRANDTWANFYVLRKTHMPAVLSENGFMTNFDDATDLLDIGVRKRIAQAHVSMMLEIEENGLG
jgi:N-acetylmuramoyl-L-alanine amidase|tara:strand:+ start:721 stop:1371 length:651 start_codon:yes stop_codon:yes gene_type:complete